MVPRSLGSSHNARNTLQKHSTAHWSSNNPPPSRDRTKALQLTLSQAKPSRHLAMSSLLWSVSMALSAFTMQAKAETTPAFSSRFTRFTTKSFLSCRGEDMAKRLVSSSCHPAGEQSRFSLIGWEPGDLVAVMMNTPKKIITEWIRKRPSIPHSSKPPWARCPLPAHLPRAASSLALASPGMGTHSSPDSLFSASPPSE